MSGGMFTFYAWQDPFISHQHGTSIHGTEQFLQNKKPGLNSMISTKQETIELEPI